MGVIALGGATACSRAVMRLAAVGDPASRESVTAEYHDAPGASPY